MSPRLNQTPAGRNAAMLRLRRLNRSLIAVAIAGTAVLTEVVAHAFPGHTIKRVARSVSVVSSTTGTATVRHHRHHTHATPLKAATTPPTSASQSTDATNDTTVQGAQSQTSTPAQSTPVESAPVQSTPAPVAVPAPVVSGGS